MSGPHSWEVIFAPKLYFIVSKWDFSCDSPWLQITPRKSAERGWAREQSYCDVSLQLWMIMFLLLTKLWDWRFFFLFLFKMSSYYCIEGNHWREKNSEGLFKCFLPFDKRGHEPKQLDELKISQTAYFIFSYALSGTRSNKDFHKFTLIYALLCP